MLYTHSPYFMRLSGLEDLLSNISPTAYTDLMPD